MRAFRKARHPMVALFLAILLMPVLNRARGAGACAQGSPAAALASAPVARCTRPVKPVTKVAPAPAVAATAIPIVADSWQGTLDPLDVGGWKLIAEGPAENPSALYASSHNLLHNGDIVTAWMRWEYSHAQAEVYPLHYLSAVTREELDCDARSYRRAAVIYYMRNNLREKGPSFTALDDDTTWKLAIPGSEADAMLEWGCALPAATPRTGAAAKAGSPPAAQSSGPAAPAGINLHTAK